MIYQPIISKTASYIARLWVANPFPLHWHDDIEIVHILNGYLEMKIEETVYHAKQGDFIIIMGGLPHEILSSSNQCLAAVVEYGYSFLGNDYETLHDRYLPNPIFSGSSNPSVLSTAIQTISSILTPGNILKSIEKWIIQSMMLQIAAYLPGISKEKKDPRRVQFRYLYPVLKYIEEHYSEKITVNRAAGIVGYSEVYFSRQFKTLVGVSFHKYLNFYRVEQARNYLSDTQMRINEISEELGFLSAKQFCRVFKEYMHMTPSEYRQLDSKLQNAVKL